MPPTPLRFYAKRGKNANPSGMCYNKRVIRLSPESCDHLLNILKRADEGRVY